MACHSRTASAALLQTCLLLAGMTLPAAAQQAEHRWEFDEPSSDIPRAISLANHGTIVFSAMEGTFASKARLLSSFDVDPASSVWESTHFGEARSVRVASSSKGTRHAVLQMVPTVGASFRPMVRAFDSTSAIPLWQWQSQTSTFLHDMNGIHVSPDGSRVVAAMYDPMIAKSHVVAFDGSTGAVLVDIEVTTFGGFRYSELSEDGESLYLGYSNRSYVVNLTGGGSSQSISTFIAALHGHAASSDSSRFAVGRLNMVRVFDRNSNGIYTPSFDLTLSGPDAWCTRLAISADDRILAAGFSLSNDRDVRVLAWDLNSGAMLIDRTFTGSGLFTNDISGLAISDDGSRIAVSTWGDQGGWIPHVMLFQTGISVPYAQFHLAGSVMGLAFSPDGKWVAVARKSTHANIAAGGGSLELFSAELQDVQVFGKPRLGGPPVRIQVEPGSLPNVFVVSNDHLESPPKVFAAGTLFVARQGLEFDALQLQGDGTYSTDWSFTLQNGNFVGQTLYFQGFSSAPRRLTHDFAAVTILP